MNQVRNNEIDVDELMQKIRKEVAGRNNLLLPTVSSSFSKSASDDFAFNHIEHLLINAESRSHIRTKWPDKLNRFPFSLTGGLRRTLLKAINFLFKDQREVNFALVQALREFIKLNRRITDQVSDLNGQVSDLNGQVLDLNGQVLDLNGQVSDLNGQVSDLNGQVSDLNGQVSDLNGQVSDLNGQIVMVSSRIQSIDTRTLTNDVYIKNDLILQKRLTTMFLEEARKRLPAPFTTSELKKIANEEKHWLDAFYVAFEDQFRGSHEAIYEKLKVYIPVLEEANVDLKLQILDIGCGRGEWLQLLHDFGYKAKGIDLNRIMVEQCCTRGLEVIEADVIDYLRSLPDESLSCVTGFHIIEHLSFEILIQLFDEIVRVLTPSGILIFETPNARNILVGSGDFYRDPTHKNPIHPDTISFIAKSRGLIDSESYFFEEVDGVLSLVRSSIKQFNDLSEYVNVSRDTALIARKASN